MNGLLQSVTENVVFLIEFLALIAACVLIAYFAQKIADKNREKKERILNTRTIAMIGVFSAIAVVLHILDFPVPFAPGFYKIDFSELAVLIGGFAYGPVAAVLIEFVKIVLKLLFKGTSTAFVGDLANFVVGCSLVLPATIIYYFKKSKMTAIIGCVAGVLCMTIVGSGFNAVYLLPKFAELYGMPLDVIIGMGTAINSGITGVGTFALLAVAPLNLLKGGLDSILTLLVYKKLSPILHGRK